MTEVQADRYANESERMSASSGLVDRYANESERMSASNGLADRYASDFDGYAMTKKTNRYFRTSLLRGTPII